MKRNRVVTVLGIALFWLGLAGAQPQQQATPADQKQDIPDAPSATRPTQPPPQAPPATTTQPVPPNEQPPGEAPANETSTPDSEAPPSRPSPSETEPTAPVEPPPPPVIKTVPEGGATQSASGGQDELYRIVVNANQVIVPVRVTDESGRLVNGLLSRDFAVYEDGKKQVMNFFTSDPLAISAAVILDLGMPDVAVQKVNKTFSALEGAFSPFDEIALYTYSDSVARLSDFGAVGRRLDAKLNELKTVTGRNNGVPVLGGPLGPQGPTINNVPIDPTVPHAPTPAKHARVLNDAILQAARDLGPRSKDRRKVIFVISDGREYRSNASYGDVLKVLLTNGIMVYGVAVEGSAIPGYKQLEKLHIPGQGYSDILPKYANATGGEILSEYSRSDIENVYQRIIGDARDEYTLGYATRATPSSTYREVEVTVANHGPGCRSSNLRPCVNVYAKAGYYPLPPGR